MSLSTALFDMVDPIHDGDLHSFLSSTRLGQNISGDESTHQPGFYNMDFNAVFDDCDPAIKALFIDASSDNATPTFPPVPVGPHDVSAPIHADATSLASGTCSSPASPLFTPVSELVLLPDVCDVAQLKALSFDAQSDRSTSNVFHTSFVSAYASPATSGSATLDASNTCSDSPASPLFTPVSETVNPLEAPYTVQAKFADNSPNDEVRRVETTRQDASSCHAPVASLHSGYLPVRAEDIDILSCPVPPVNANMPDTASQSAKVTDATTLASFELSPIPGSRLVNITRKRRRSLIVRDDTPEVSAKEEARPTPPLSAPHAIDTRTVVPPDQSSVPIELLDQIAARAVAATIRASPGINVFAAKPYTKQARKAKALQNQFSGQVSFGYDASSTSSYTAASAIPIAQTGGMQANGQWHPAGISAPASMVPTGFLQTNVYAQQAYIANAMPQATSAWSPSLASGFYGPWANTNGNSSQTINDPIRDPMASNYPQQAFSTSGNYRARPFTVPRNSSPAPPFRNQALINAQAAKIRRMLGLLHSQGMATRQVQQPATSSNQFGFTGLSNAQPQPHMSMQQAVSSSMTSMPGTNPLMVRQNWMDSSSTNTQYPEIDGFTPIHTQTSSSLPMQRNLVNQNLHGFLPAQQTCSSASPSQAPTGSPLSEPAFADDAPFTVEDATNRPFKRRKHSQLTFPDSDEPVEVPQPVGIREAYHCRIDGCNKPISILRNGAWSVRRVLQEHSHISESPSDEVIVCQWVDGKGKRCLQQTKWANYTRHFSGHLGILARDCEFCGSLQARPSNLTRHYKSCKSFHQQDRKTQEDAWSKLNTRQDFSECEKAMEEKMRNAENRRARRRRRTES